MAKELVNKQTGEVQVSSDWSQEQIQLIKDTVAVGCTDDEFKLFIYVCQKSGLDPLAKQIHAYKRWNSALNRETMTVQTGIDGYRVIADRTGNLAGIDNPDLQFTQSGSLLSATVTVYRIVNGERVSFTATAYYDEYVQTKKDGNPNSMWAKMPKSQLSKCAEALALRKAFPNDLSGIYTHEEMQQADSEPVSNSAPVRQAIAQEQTKVSPQNYMDGFPSKYGTQEKPNNCIFCGKDHVVKGDRITKDDVSGKYGSVVCKQVNDNKQPEAEAVDPRIEKFIELDIEDLLEVTENTEIEYFGDPRNTDSLKNTMSCRYTAVNKKKLGIAELVKNSKGMLANYICYILDNYKPLPPKDVE